MYSSFVRALALPILTMISLSTVVDIVTAPPAFAAPEDARVVFAAFPHITEDVRFTDNWGARRPGGRRHTGIDIMSPRGSEIVAVADGIVTKLGSGGSAGFNIRIDHGGGLETMYLHLNNDTPGTDDGEGGAETAFNPTLKEGDKVRAGDVIGYVGDSGNAEHTIPHTHFAMSVDGKKQNPYPYLNSVWNREHRFVSPDHGPL